MHYDSTTNSVLSIRVVAAAAAVIVVAVVVIGGGSRIIVINIFHVTQLV